ncbi:DUF502 domain-containing protein [Candidatus Protochlamydia sp. W-9]|uniref:DUF502 domain-containing protein n=1 Tax=Candidatus Protochlamydia sp. W-9 TaxID=1785087 RepID=UPI00096A3F00|nr:DUF502 domain-containing protein [Candidatus Protochlamydia sp. W-9]
MKKSFLTGFAILFPVILTIIILGFFINFLTYPFLNLTKFWLNQFNWYENSFILFADLGITHFISQLLILGLLIGIIFGVGLLGQFFLINYILKLGNTLILAIPYINKIYKFSQEFVFSLFSSHSKPFAYVVLVPYPSVNHLSLGFVSKSLLNFQEHERLISVFIPGTPNPSIGYTLKFKKKDLLFLDMKIDEAMKFVISFGTITHDFKLLDPNKCHEI